MNKTGFKSFFKKWLSALYFFKLHPQQNKNNLQQVGNHRQVLNRFYLLGVVALIAVGFAVAEQAEPVLAQPPSGFVDELVTSLAGPTALAFTPDGRILITQQTGQLRVIENGALLSTPALDLSDPNQDGNYTDSLICNDTERGVLGVAVDPNFATNHYVYLYYTYDQAKINNEGICPRRGQDPENPYNTVGRFVLPANNQIDLATQTILLTNIENMSGNHNAGDLHFGADGFLYVSAGDGGIPPDLSPRINSQLTTNLNGKILRIASDGSFPNDNPYAADNTVRRCGDPAGVPAGSGPCGEIYAKGLRNPFRFSIKPGTNLLHINDVGQNEWEEIDLAVPGADYGWHVREGPCPYPSEGGARCGVEDSTPFTTTPPMHTYNHSSGCASVTGSAFVPSGVWPASYSGAYLFADYVCAKIFKLTESAPYTTAKGGSYQFNYTGEELFSVPNNLAPVSMTFGPYASTQALYYAACPKDNNCSAGGQIRRIRYTGSDNRSPTALISADKTFGAAPLTVNFDASNSSDPDSDPLVYDWDFGDGETVNNSASATIQHTYTVTGTYTAQLIVRDNQGGTSDPVTLSIEVGNTPPSPVIISPTVALQFYVGQTITLIGSAQDQEEGNLPDNKLSWQVIQHHVDAINPGNTHTHPWVPLTAGNNIQFTTPDMEDSYAYDSYLEIALKATDSFGSSTTVTQTLLPHHVELTFQTQPAGLVLKVGQLSTLAPRAITVWEKSHVVVEAVSPQTSAGKSYVFDSWSDGGLPQHALVAPGVDASYTATFVDSSATPTPTATKIPTLTATPTATQTSTPSSTPTATPTQTPTSTVTPTVTPVATPSVVVVSDSTGAPGSTFVFMGTHFLPNSRQLVYLKEKGQAPSETNAAQFLGEVAIDAKGEVRLTVVTSDSTVIGTYQLSVGGLSGASAEFSLVATAPVRKPDPAGEVLTTTMQIYLPLINR